MTSQPHNGNDPADMAARRASARRTALVVAGVSLAVYVGFLALNVMAQ